MLGNPAPDHPLAASISSGWAYGALVLGPTLLRGNRGPEE